MGLRNNIKVIVVLIFSLITQSITVSEAQSQRYWHLERELTQMKRHREGVGW